MPVMLTSKLHVVRGHGCTSGIQGTTPCPRKGHILLLYAASRIVTLMFSLLSQAARLFALLDALWLRS